MAGPAIRYQWQCLKCGALSQPNVTTFTPDVGEKDMKEYTLDYLGLKNERDTSKFLCPVCRVETEHKIVFVKKGVTILNK